MEFHRKTSDSVSRRPHDDFGACNTLTKNQGLKQISVLNVNIRSLNTHFDKRTSYPRYQYSTQRDCLTESWLRVYHDVEQFTLPGYHKLKLLTCNRSDGTRGGVVIGFDENFKYREKTNFKRH